MKEYVPWIFAAFIVILIALGMYQASTHPPKPLTAEESFIRSCQYRNGVPDTHTNNWTCQGISSRY